MARVELLVRGPKGPIVSEEEWAALTTLPPSRVVVYLEEGEAPPSLPPHHKYTVVRLGREASPRRPLRLRVWEAGGVPPAPYVHRGRPWEGAVRFVAQAIRLGKIPPVLWTVGWRTAREAAQALQGLGRAITREVLRGGNLPIRGGKIPIPGWAYPTLDGLGGEAARERQKAFQNWLAASREEVGEEWWAEDRSRKDWAHDTGRPAPSWAHALLRAWEELREEGRPLPQLTPEVFRGALLRLLRGGGRLYVHPQVQEALEERAIHLREGGWFPPTAGGLGVEPGLLEELLEVPGFKTGPGTRRAFSLQEMEGATALFLSFRKEEPPLEGVAQVLEALGLEWPQYPGQVPRGISPLFWLVHWAREEGRWGSLAERLGTWNKRALRLARDLQKAVRTGATLEAAAREMAVPLEEARNVWSLLQQESLEEWMRVEESGAELPHLRTYEEVVEEDDHRQQALSLRLALEAIGVTAEEALADPALLAEVARLARAFYGEE